jgi:hypothetical protein
MKRKVFYVSYDVRKGDVYTDLINELKRLKGRRVLESVWTIKLSDKRDANIVMDKLFQLVDKKTGMIVVGAKDQDFRNTIEDPHKIDL